MIPIYTEIMISSNLTSGLLETLVLKILEEDGPSHGYAIVPKIEALTTGKIKFSHASLYPVLHKMKREKMVVAASEIHKNRLRYHYALTPKGHSAVIKRINELNEFIDVLQQIARPRSGAPNA